MHVYVHIPFCARRCSYCDFAIAIRRNVPSERFVDRALAEWGGWLQHPVMDRVERLSTIYLGGGTPSRLAPPEVARLIGGLTATRSLHEGAEITLEANPEDVTPDAAEWWLRAGVNRVSLGAQAFDPRVLAWMHRTHSAEQVPAAVRILRKAGFTRLSLDLIYALPGELERDWPSDLEHALALEPDHLSLYGLTVEPKTPLGRWVDRGQARPAHEDRYAAEFLEAHQRLTAAGFDHYEVSNYGRPGARARHNSAYWKRASYIGLGPSAHSASGTHRQWNLAEWAAWDRAVASGGSPVAEQEELTPEALGLEELYLGLRTSDGIARERIAPSLRAAWVQAGWATEVGGVLKLEPEGWLRLDALVAQAG